MRRALLILVTAIVSTAQAQVQTPGPQDVPQPVTGDIGLAGTSLPDIARFLNVRTASAPSLSRDGRWLSYLTNTTGHPQLWIARGLGCPPAGCAPKQLTFGEQSVTFHEYSPIADRIIYGTDRAGDEREGYYLISLGRPARSASCLRRARRTASSEAGRRTESASRSRPRSGTAWTSTSIQWTSRRTAPPRRRDACTKGRRASTS